MTGYYSKQMTLLAIVFITACNAIIVDWNTNKGPIVPPTSTQQPIPQKPYRTPAPVWEDQSNDIPNPNPYVYVLPPPSRPKYNDIDSGYQKPQAPNTNQIINHPKDNQGNPSVPSLTVQYVPNVGNQYVAVVASPSSAATNYNTNNNHNNNFVTNSHSIAQSQQQINYNINSDINNNNNNNNNNNKWDYIKTNKLDKLNGKYSDKLRKYKSYEKFNTKFLPYYMYVQVPAKQTYYYQQQPQQQQQQQASNYYQQQPQTFPQQINTSYKSNISKS